MNAEKFFEQHSIEEISKKTKISPISLRFIKNKEFKKIPRVKFIGFIRLIEREFKVDLSELIEEFDQINKTPKTQKEEPKIQNPQKTEKNYFLYILVAIILILSGIGIYLYNNPKQTTTPQNNQTIQIPNKPLEINNSNQTTATQLTPLNNDKNLTADLNLTNDYNSTKESNQTKKSIPTEVMIIPLQKLWYKITNLDTNQSYSYLTTRIHTFKGTNFYIKLGHGMEIIKYGDLNITPNTKKVVRILLTNGTYKFVKATK